MKRIIEAAKELSRGVFWVIDGELLAFPFIDDVGVAKSGNTYNHKMLWPHIKPAKCKKSYNYYPRGRVEITRNGSVRIYMNPNIGDDMIPRIKFEFGIVDEPKILYDGSSHYRCYLDEGFKPGT